MCHGERVGEVLDHDSCQKPDSTHWGWDGFISGNSIENSTSTFHMKEVIDTGIDRPWISSVDGRCVSIIPATYGVGSVVAGALWSSIVGDIPTVWSAWWYVLRLDASKLRTVGTLHRLHSFNHATQLWQASWIPYGWFSISALHMLCPSKVAIRAARLFTAMVKIRDSNGSGSIIVVAGVVPRKSLFAELRWQIFLWHPIPSWC